MGLRYVLPGEAPLHLPWLTTRICMTYNKRGSFVPNNQNHVHKGWRLTYECWYFQLLLAQHHGSET